MGPRVRAAAVGGAAVALLVTATGGALAASSPATLYACFDPAGNVRMSDVAKCTLSGGRLVSWTPMGQAGPIGAVGPTGAAGVTGPAGTIGVPGVQGVVGPVGATGLIGAAGPAGAQGTAGAGGSSGPVGPAGAAGPAGATGDPGAPGLTRAAARFRGDYAESDVYVALWYSTSPSGLDLFLMCPPGGMSLLAHATGDSAHVWTANGGDSSREAPPAYAGIFIGYGRIPFTALGSAADGRPILYTGWVEKTGAGAPCTYDFSGPSASFTVVTVGG